MAKKHTVDTDNGVEWESHSGGGSNRPRPRDRVLEHGLVLSIYPDEATLATMREENWTTVTVGYEEQCRRDHGAVAPKGPLAVALARFSMGLPVPVR